MHVSELVSCGIFGRYVALLLGKAATETELEEGIEEILKGIEKYVVFVQTEDNIETKTRTVITKIDASSPKAIIVFSKGQTTIKKANKIIETVKEKIENYAFEKQFDPEFNQQYDFILKESQY